MKSLLLLILVLLGGCASMRETFQMNYCNHESAYALGRNDAQRKRLMNTQYATQCREEQKEIFRRGYREGYLGIQTPPVEAVSQPQAASIAPAPTGGDIDVHVGAPKKFECHQSRGKKEVCGYNCILSRGKWHCADRP
ncbi:MAG: hypothetical protein V4534_06500 [Myxococcota bacterium]